VVATSSQHKLAIVSVLENTTVVKFRLNWSEYIGHTPEISCQGHLAWNRKKTSSACDDLVLAFSIGNYFGLVRLQCYADEKMEFSVSEKIYLPSEIQYVGWISDQVYIS
jgi:hypothetical protein